jgi:5-methyltetrahydropteroyltriglutamate--homocysteine methyltransferase
MERDGERAREGGDRRARPAPFLPEPAPLPFLLHPVPHAPPLRLLTHSKILDWTFYLGLAPKRFDALAGLAKYFAMARGVEGAEAEDMSKLFDTNYHYMVPELSGAAVAAATPDWAMFLDRVKRGQEAVGKEAAVPIVFGPNTLVGLAKPAEGSGDLDRSAAVAALLPHYEAVLKELKALGVPEVQIHEPILASEKAGDLRADFEATYAKLAGVGLSINLVTAYDDIGEAYSWAVNLPVAAISLDLLGVPGSAHKNATAALIEKHGFPAGKRLGAGVVDGRSVWADGGAATTFVAALLAKGIESVSVQSSVSLQHLPYDLELEPNLPADLKAKLAFATQKLGDIVAAAKGAPSAKAVPLADALAPVANPTADVPPAKFVRELPFDKRRDSQVKMPAFPTTSIGSFPQTPEIRRARLAHKKGQLTDAEYEKEINAYMKYAVDEQARVGIDVMVHGEPERTDMVEYFGQRMDGFTFTEHGWVQSYGSRYVRPPIIHGDVTRPGAMTVKEFEYAQSLTDKPVKGMLTGPVTILNWSFPRKDITRQAQAFQLALALRDEVADLEKAGCRVIQVDEPALREGLPLKRERWASYLDWAVDAFKLATVVAAPSTQVVTHLCYSEFSDILAAIDGLDADVLTIENSRSGDEMVVALAKYGYGRDLGAGVYDVHSPVVPTVEFMKAKIAGQVATGILSGHMDRLWVNPDCGLKTREWAQVLPSLENMCKAAAEMRATL